MLPKRKSVPVICNAIAKQMVFQTVTAEMVTIKAENSELFHQNETLHEEINSLKQQLNMQQQGKI